MTLDLTPETHVRRDKDGIVRQLSHAREPYRPGAASFLAAGVAQPRLTPRALAEHYLRDASEVFGFTQAATANFAATTSGSPTQAGVELRFKEEKAQENAVTVAYDQTVLGLPIWNAGVTVRVNGAELSVTGSHNATHYDVQVRPPKADSAYLPHSMDATKVAALLGLTSSQGLTITSTRALVYLYRQTDRFDAQIKAHAGSDPEAGFGKGAPQFPSLPLPPVPSAIVAEKHYVVTEVLFSLPVKEWGQLNWRAFVEPESGAILYLRALVSCAIGAVFLTDPVSSAGILHSAATATSVLDSLRTRLPLLGLMPPNPAGGPQKLNGDLVRLVDLELPAKPMPTENPPHEFVYSANTDNFAACSAYYHCDAVFRLIQGMGIDVASYFNNTDFPVPVDPHAKFGQVNAACPGNAAGNGIGRLVFGVAQAGTTFGISSDVRVVIHEFGHGVLWDHVDSPNFGFAHSPGDSLAVILHDPGSRAPDRFESFPFMNTSAGLSRRHDRSVQAGWAWGGIRDDTQYGSEQILSTTLFRVYRAAGGDSENLTEKQYAARYVSYLILKAVSLLSFTTADPDVYVSALNEADATTGLFEGHPGGAFSKVFRWSFEKQGLYQADGAPSPVQTPGAPPDVDVYIDDGRGGEYMPFLPDFAGNAEIWNRHGADGGTANQNPAIGVTNFAFVRVRNRGTSSATGVVVRAFKARAPAAAVWPTDFKPLAQPALAVPAALPAGGAIVVGPFAWTPEFANDTLLFGVSATGDRSNLETVTAGPIANARLVPLDNNIAQRTF
jgi:zinc metalloprotease ZmpB